MQKLTKFQLPNGQSILIEETDAIFSGGQPVGLGQNVSDSAAELLDQYLSISNFIAEFKSKIDKALTDASEISIEFGVKVGADVGIFVAKSQVEANFKVSVSWKK